MLATVSVRSSGRVHVAQPPPARKDDDLLLATATIRSKDVAPFSWRVRRRRGEATLTFSRVAKGRMNMASDADAAEAADVCIYAKRSIVEQAMKNDSEPGMGLDQEPGVRVGTLVISTHELPAAPAAAKAVGGAATTRHSIGDGSTAVPMTPMAVKPRRCERVLEIRVYADGESARIAARDLPTQCCGSDSDSSVERKRKSRRPPPPPLPPPALAAMGCLGMCGAPQSGGC